jgi:predicted transcriptional regulator
MDDATAGRDEAAARRFVEHMAMTLASYGMPRMAARVLMALMSADEESLTAADLSARLEVSPAAVSGAVRYLMHVGMVIRDPVPGSRRDRYRLPDDAWWELTATKGGFLKQLADIADDGVKALGGPGTPSGARVAEMRDFYLFWVGEIPAVLDRWRASRGGP